MTKRARVQYELMTSRKDIPPDASATDVGNMVAAILCLPGSTVKSLRVQEGEGSEPSFIEWDYMLPKSEPPDGDIPEPQPEDIWQTLAKIEVKEVAPKGHSLNLNSLNIITSMLLHASRNKMVGVGWITGDLKRFKKWLGLKAKRSPSRFLGIPLVKVDGLPEDKLVMLAARGTDVSPLDAELGFSVAMLGKEGSDGRGKEEKKG